MTDLEKAARMALKTLEYIDLQDNDRDFLSYKECHDLDEAITALRQAISNSVERPAKERHIAYVCPQCQWTLEEQSAQQEPVGQLMEEAYGRGQVLWFNKPDDFSMLYTSPQRKPWVGLTPEEVKEISLANRPYVVDMVVALEQRLKEKNT